MDEEYGSLTERCPSAYDGMRCGLGKGHGGDHCGLIETSAPWFPKAKEHPLSPREFVLRRHPDAVYHQTGKLVVIKANPHSGRSNLRAISQYRETPEAAWRSAAWALGWRPEKAP